MLEHFVTGKIKKEMQWLIVQTTFVAFFQCFPPICHKKQMKPVARIVEKRTILNVSHVKRLAYRIKWLAHIGLK
jgi:hypothetical protein